MHNLDLFSGPSVCPLFRPSVRPFEVFRMCLYSAIFLQIPLKLYMIDAWDHPECTKEDG